MNSLRPTVMRTAVRHVRRATTTTGGPSFVPKNYQKSFKKEWLSDPSTYPIIFIMGIAMTFVVGMTANALITYPDVQIDPKKRTTQMRDWGKGDHQPTVGKAIWRWSWQATAPEGMGVDHEKWVEGKKEYYKDIRK